MNRTEPPTLTNGIARRCCKRRTLGIEIFRKAATSGIVNSSDAGAASIDIVVRERGRIGNYPQAYLVSAKFANRHTHLRIPGGYVPQVDGGNSSKQIRAHSALEGKFIQ